MTVHVTYKQGCRQKAGEWYYGSWRLRRGIYYIC